MQNKNCDRSKASRGRNGPGQSDEEALHPSPCLAHGPNSMDKNSHVCTWPNWSTVRGPGQSDEGACPLLPAGWIYSIERTPMHVWARFGQKTKWNGTKHKEGRSNPHPPQGRNRENTPPPQKKSKFHRKRRVLNLSAHPSPCLTPRPLLM